MFGQKRDLISANFIREIAVLGHVVVSAQIGGLDDFVTYPNGDVGWAAAWDDMSTLQIVRVAACE